MHTCSKSGEIVNKKLLISTVVSVYPRHANIDLPDQQTFLTAQEVNY